MVCRPAPFRTVKHAGFGVGLERFILYLTGIGNIRDTIPYPRTPGEPYILIKEAGMDQCKIDKINELGGKTGPAA